MPVDTAGIIDEYNVCVLLPTYNNGGTLAKVIEGIRKITTNLIVVNDGSIDATSHILEQYSDIQIISYPENKGKGFALRTGIQYAISKGYHFALAIDSDGQHNPADIVNFIEKLQEGGEALIIGERNMEQATVPGKSNFGRKFSNFWFWIESGIRQNDTQSGYRLYPLLPIKDMKLYTRKFEFEIEILVRLAWKGVKIESVPVTVHYFPKEERVSHFRPFKDFARISVLNTVLVFLAITWYRPMMYLRGKDWLELFFNKKESITKRSLSVAFGVFMGIVPIWGFQLVTAIALALAFRLNKPLVILFANISIPPMIPFIIFLSMFCGRFWIGGATLPPLDSSLDMDTIRPFFEQYLYGSISLSILAATIFGIGTYMILSTLRLAKK